MKKKLPATKQRTSTNWKEELFSWYKILLLTVSISIFINSSVIANSHVPTGSMETTIMSNDRVVGFRLQYLFAKPKRGDVVIFQYPDDESILFVKRVIGLPGETVKIVNGQIYVNDNTYALDEPYLAEEMRGSFGPYVIPDDYYFVMGDNRNHSLDSRYWKNTFVSQNKILAKVFFRYFPNIELIN
ncbi:signal peptidase I [Clostridia bacterium]|nr:signal peptidase I [Clostridia bacterium]